MKTRWFLFDCFFVLGIESWASFVLGSTLPLSCYPTKEAAEDQDPYSRTMLSRHGNMRQAGAQLLSLSQSWLGTLMSMDGPLWQVSCPAVAWWLIAKEEGVGSFVYTLWDRHKPTSLCWNGTNAIEHIGWCVCVWSWFLVPPPNAALTPS